MGRNYTPRPTPTERILRATRDMDSARYWAEHWRQQYADCFASPADIINANPFPWETP